MYKIALLSGLCILLNMSYAKALLCDSGYDIKSNFINFNQMEKVECRTIEDELCLRGESIVDFLVPVNMTVGACVRPNRCEEDCLILIQEASNDVFGLREQTFNLSFCDRVCCNTDFCNEKSVKEIIMNNDISEILSTSDPFPSFQSEGQEETTASPSNSDSLETTTASNLLGRVNPSKNGQRTLQLTGNSNLTNILGTRFSNISETQSSESIFSERTCAVGFEIEQYAIARWSLQECNSFESFACLRHEFAVQIDQDISMNVSTGFCSNSSTCADSCFELVHSISQSNMFDESILANVSLEALSITSCNRICCDSDNCNQNTVNQLENETNRENIASTIDTEIETMTSAIRVTTELFDVKQTTEGKAGVLTNNKLLTIFSAVLSILIKFLL